MTMPIVFLHGFLGNARSFASVIAQLPVGHPTLSPELFGHRGQPEPALEHSFEAEVERLLVIIQAHFKSSPAHLVGYSMGGRLALALLLRAPQQFRSATLISARRGLDELRARASRLEEDSAWAKMLQTMPLLRFLDAWERQPLFASQQQLAPHVLTQLREQRLTHDPFALSQSITALSLAQMPSFQGALSGVHCQVNLMVGGQDPKFCALAADLAERIHGSRTIVVSGAGHNLPLERPDSVAAAISEEMDDGER
jgi:2-succinyl-6-hydroxy-2,4-cyclohexadiene-1-carboxylate synthase